MSDYDTRKKNQTWRVARAGDAGATWEGAQLAVLMDLRDELQTLNRILGCPNFLRVPRPKRKKRKAKEPGR